MANIDTGRKKFRISSLQSPLWKENNLLWDFYRLCNTGGQAFRDVQLKKFTSRETDDDFTIRKSISYSPSFAKIAVHKVFRSIYQRMSEIRRVGGSESYNQWVSGLNGGVDRQGKSMNSFMGQTVLPELGITGMVGVFVDRPEKKGELLADNKGQNTYVYAYSAEDIYNWDAYYQDNMQVFTNLLLKMTDYSYDEETGLCTGTEQFTRRYWINKDNVVQYDDYFYDAAKDEDVIKRSKVTQLTFIPFVLGRISESLYTDIGDYQNSLLQLASADMNYCFRANFPFLTEQADLAFESSLAQRRIPQSTTAAPTVPGTTPPPPQGSAIDAMLASSSEQAAVSPTKGRKYGKGLERPEFIAPPAEPLEMSMKKQDRMAAEVEKMLHLTITNLQPTRGDAPKGEDPSVNTGLSYIGEEMQYIENCIARFHTMYENNKSKPAQVNYPEKYELKSDNDRVSLSKDLVTLKGAAPSKTFQKEVGKEIATTLLSGKTPVETLATIHKEIDAAKYITSDCEEIAKDVEMGLVPQEVAAEARGYDPSGVALAQEQHLLRLERIAVAQAKNKGDGANAARGVSRGPQDDSDDEEKELVKAKSGSDS